MNKYLDTKKVAVRFPNDDTFYIPAEVIAEQRTKYYSEVDGFENGSNEWQREFTYSMREEVLIEWIQNSLDWKDIKEYAIKQENKIDESYYDDKFTNSEFDVIDLYNTDDFKI